MSSIKDGKLLLRKATKSDLALLTYWDQQKHVIESDPNDDWNWEVELEYDPFWREQLIAEWENEAIGFVQIIDPAHEESHYWGAIDDHKRAIDIWIGEEKNLGRGLGTLMMSEALKRCFAQKEVQEVIIDPLETNTGAIKFYESIGFEFVERRRFHMDDCLVYKMTRDKWRTMLSLSNNSC